MKRCAVLLVLALFGGLVGLSPASSSTSGSTSGSSPTTVGTSPSAGEPVTVFFVRHAETAGSTRSGGDPGLSEVGRTRAENLARLLGRVGATRFYSSEFARTRGTLEPLLASVGEEGAEIEVISARKGDDQVEALRALEPGTVVVVAGHSNTVPAMVLGLGGKLADVVQHERYGPMLEHHQYDRLFCVTLDPVSGVALSTIELAYGEPCAKPTEEPR